MATTRKVYAGNLSWATTNDDLRRVFSSCGNIFDLNVVRNPKNGLSRGYGFITFGLEEEARNAIVRLNGLKLDGRCIKVLPARPRVSGIGIGIGVGYGDQGSRGYSTGGHDGYRGDYGVSRGSFGQPTFGSVPQGGPGHQEALRDAAAKALCLLSSGGHGQEGFQQYGYGPYSGGGHIGQGGYQHGGHKGGRYF